MAWVAEVEVAQVVRAAQGRPGRGTAGISLPFVGFSWGIFDEFIKEFFMGGQKH